MAVESKNEIFKLLEEVGLSNISDEIQHMIKYSIEITTSPIKEEKLKIGQSKIGGHPDLPPSINWPVNKNQPLAFICQINLKDIYPYDQEKILPESGMLYFFYDSENQPWGYDPNSRSGWRVIYNDNDSDLQRKDPPLELASYNIFNSCQISFKNLINLPPFDSVCFDELSLSKEDEKKLLNFQYQIIKEEDKVNHRLLGYPEAIEGDMMSVCQLVSNGIDYENLDKYEQFALDKYKDGITDWRLLLQIDSDELNAGMAWGNFGMLYFWIKENDLINKDFDNVWLILQSE